MNPTRILPILLVIVAVAAVGCSSSSDNPADGDADVAEESTADAEEALEMSDSADLDVAAEEALEEHQEVTPRKLVDGADGFCNNTVAFDDFCDTEADCVGYFTAPRYNCYATDTYAETSPACLFARAATFPAEPICAADELCIDAPRTCLDHHCTPAQWDRSCTQDADCAMKDMGCACIGISATAAEPVLTFGRQCPASGGCPEDAGVHCHFNRCVVVGSFLDEGLRRYCELCEGATFPAPTGTDACIEAATKDNYHAAMSSESLSMAALTATTCQGLMYGPAQWLFYCLTVR